jgi:hypothetical protein
MKFSNFHLAVSSFAAVAGVALAAYQTLRPPARRRSSRSM